jgi:hypothetical protein
VHIERTVPDWTMVAQAWATPGRMKETAGTR